MSADTVQDDLTAFDDVHVQVGSVVNISISKYCDIGIFHVCNILSLCVAFVQV